MFSSTVKFNFKYISFINVAYSSILTYQQLQGMMATSQARVFDKTLACEVGYDG
jgi:hypothetical protein